ncbi:Structural maintenance of chromosomes protein 5 [Spathaspora sp. JA1]|nr:Structural maintenance of chromosomes protein 5 [Spathaspora sp. JA1]
MHDVKRRKLYIEQDEEDLFKPGSIKTVKVWNFTTYSFGEFKLSPNLNMIIGPNGSGKSTLVASICIGLGGKIDLIKRKNLKSMIKMGHERASVEITLQGKLDEDVIVKREFTAKDSVWSINGRKTNEASVKDLRKKLNIQLDNLCHFLPQERAAEFAALSPEKLLLEIERTLGDGHLLNIHQDLISKDLVREELVRKIEEISSRLKHLYDEQEKLQQETKKLQEYEAKTQEIENHKMLIPYAQMSDLKHQIKELKRKQKSAKKKLLEFDNTVKGLQQDQEETLEKIEEQETKLAKQQAGINRLEGELADHTRDQTKIKLEIDQLQAQAKSLQTKSHEKKLDLETLKRDLQSLIEKKSRLEEVDEEEIAKLSELSKEKTQEIRKLHDKIEEEKYNKDSIMNEYNRSKKRMNEVQKKLESTDKLDLLSNSRFRNRLRDESFEGHRRLRAANQYKDCYFEAPVISCDITVKEFASAFEKLIDNNTLFSITTTSQDNYQKIQDYAHSIQKNFPIRFTKLIEKPLPDISDKHLLESHGFDGYLSDFIVGPPAVLCMLYDTIKIHNIPISKKPLSVKTIEKLTTPDSRTNRVPFMKFVSGDTLFRIQRSNYGNKQLFYITEKINYNSEYFNSTGMSQELKNELNTELSNIRQLGNTKKIEIQQVMESISEYQNSENELKQELELVKQNRDNLQSIKNKHAAMDGILSNKRKALEKTEHDANKDYTNKINQIDHKILEKYDKMSGIIHQITEITNNQISKQMSEFILTKLTLLNLTNRKLSIESLLDELDVTRNELLEEYRVSKQEYDKLKQGDAAQQIQQQSKDYTEEERATLSELANKYIENNTFTEALMLQKIALLEDERSIMSIGDHSSVETLKKNLKDIEIGEIELPRIEVEKTRLDKRIEDIQASWEPELTELINQISMAFNKRFTHVASDGNVQLQKSDRFKDWKLQILVKFRQESELKILDNQSQSGGERSVSTIFFIMALQGLTDAPFRIVDEINQGMDPNNEKLAHRYLVHTACQNNNSQYFLITPKLLPGLYYHPNMVVHCIYTGSQLEVNDDNQGFLDFIPKPEAIAKG